MLTIVQRSGGLRGKPPISRAVRGYSSRLPWVWDGLCFAVPFTDATQDAARDIVVNAAPSTVSGLGWTRDNRGNVAAAMGISSYLSYPDNPAHNAPAAAVTVYVRVRRASQSYEESSGLLTKRYAAVAPWLSWGIITDVANGPYAAHMTVAGDWWYWVDTYTPNLTDWLSVVLRWRSGEAPVLMVFGERGDLKSSAVNPYPLTGAISYASGLPITFNATERDDLNYWADYSQGMVWSRYLTDAELQALVEDPFGWYSPRRSTVGSSSPYPLVFGGGEMRGIGGMGGMY